jgi:hypothetical protein
MDRGCASAASINLPSTGASGPGTFRAGPSHPPPRRSLCPPFRPCVGSSCVVGVLARPGWRSPFARRLSRHPRGAPAPSRPAIRLRLASLVSSQLECSASPCARLCSECTGGGGEGVWVPEAAVDKRNARGFVPTNHDAPPETFPGAMRQAFPHPPARSSETQTPVLLPCPA